MKSSTQPAGTRASIAPEIEALIRLMSNTNGTLEPLSIAPGINFALEQLLINERRTDAHVTEANLNVLNNLLTLVRFV